MKATLIEQLCKKYIIPSLPGYSIKGDLLYLTEVDYLLRAFSFESSAFSKNRFTIEVFIQPLYMPVEYLFFNFGNRLGTLSKGYDYWWEYDESTEEEMASDILSAIKRYGVKFLEKGKSLETFVKKFGKRDRFSNLNNIEAIGYAYILVDKYRDPVIQLNKLHRNLHDEINKHPEITWLFNMDNRVVAMLDLLNSGEYKKAKQQLLDWRLYTLSNLKISGNPIEI